MRSRIVSEVTRSVNQAASQLEGAQEAKNGKAPNPTKDQGALAQGLITTSMAGETARRANHALMMAAALELA
jgi:hypothetical protein